MLSTTKVCLFSHKKKNTSCNLANLRFVVKSMMSKEFVLQFDAGESLRVTLEDREDLLDLLKMRFINICPKKGLKFYGIH